MAHDIADLMHAAEHAQGAEASAARATCRDAIVALWKHRAGASDRLARMGTLSGWTQLLRLRNAPSFALDNDYFATPEDGNRSETEIYFALASMFRGAANPLVRAALHAAAQSVGPKLVEEVNIAALAHLETEEMKVTRLLIGWSEKKVFQMEEMRAEVEGAIAQFNKGAKVLLDALERLSVEEQKAGDTATSADDVPHRSRAGPGSVPE
jgi:hypothetical protein